MALIASARRTILDSGDGVPAGGQSIEGWIERSWRRCLAAGERPARRLSFDPISAQQLRRVADDNRPLVQAALPVLERLSRAIAGTRYFGILTDANGVVVHTHGAIDRSDMRATSIARVGVDLSERAVGTTAIGAALGELRPVWLHRGEHFFDDNSIYSCAGAPVIGPDGRCVGMLDLTGVDVPERPELIHLVTESARSIESRLVLAEPHALVLRLNWPCRSLTGDDGGLVAVSEDGFITGMNGIARQLLPRPPTADDQDLHCSDLFAMPWQMLFDAARTDRAPQDVPLWSGLCLTVQAMRPEQARRDSRTGEAACLPLRDVETTLIRKAVDEARGNVTEAARLLGISRATVYRKLARPAR